MEELDLRELISIFWSKRIEIILITLIAVIVGVIYSYFFIVPQYTVAASMVLVTGSQASDSTITSTDLTINSKLVSTYSDIIKRNVVLGKVAENLELNEDEVQRIKGRISVNQVSDTEIIEIKVKDEDPNYAAKIANEIATVFSEKIVEIYNLSNVYLLDRADAQIATSNVNHIKDIAIFCILGLVISVAYVLIFNMLDHTIKTEEDIEKLTGLVVLSAISNYDVELKNEKGGKR